jgi:hypothetical protein
MTLDSDTPTLLRHSSSYKSLDTPFDFFVGGVANISAVSSAQVFSASYFEGCISQPQVNGVNLRSQTPVLARNVETTSACETVYCQSNVCHNGGDCYQLFDGIYCDCAGNYTGATCDEGFIFLLETSQFFIYFIH